MLVSIIGEMRKKKNTGPTKLLKKKKEMGAQILVALQARHGRESMVKVETFFESLELEDQNPFGGKSSLVERYRARERERESRGFFLSHFRYPFTS